MRIFLNFLLIILLMMGSAVLAANIELPEVDGQKVVAMVNDDPITLEELNRAIAASHEKKPRESSAGRVDYSNIIKRLINTRLILLEAQNMGLNELPEIKSTVNAYSRQLMMEMLIENHVADIQVQEEEVEKVYHAAVREWKIKSARIKKESDARKIESQLKDEGF